MKSNSRTRVVTAACVATMLVCSFMGQTARAAQRKFLVMLATSPKQFNGSLPPGGLTNPQLIWEQYFDDEPDNEVGSFAEYWEEISYGDVTITGDVTDWINLPWRIQARARATPADFANLSGDGLGIYNYGAGEYHTDVLPFDVVPMVLVDLDGDPRRGNDNAFDNGPFAGLQNPIYARGTSDGAWTPGERFLDLDNDGKWDGLDEANNEMDFFDNALLIEKSEGRYFADFEFAGVEPGVVQQLQTPDGRPDLLGPWIDLNGNGDPEVDGGCVYLSDSDNDGNPDCCPNGPGTVGCEGFAVHGVMACLATTWTDRGGNQIVDCNGNLIPDACDVSPKNQPSSECQASGWLAFDEDCDLCGTSPDEVPYVEGNRGCQAGPPNGIPDECEYSNFRAQCKAEDDVDSDCSEANRENCLPISRATSQRCEFHDANGNGQLDVVEPFENFLVGVPKKCFGGKDEGDLCEVHADCLPCEVDAQCPNPDGRCYGHENYRAGYEAYITDNYPRDATTVIAQSAAPELVVPHSPSMCSITGALCVSQNDCGELGEICLARTILSSECVCRDGSQCAQPGAMCVAGVHAAYDPPEAWGDFEPIQVPGDTWYDQWTDLGDTKLVERGFLITKSTPKPSWYKQAWEDRYSGGQEPAWRTSIPIMVPLVTDPDPPADQQNELTRRAFRATRGGMTGLGTGLPPDVSEQDVEDAFVFPEQMHGDDAPLVYYDGPVEHDDLPSSKYHSAGDQRLGEITSPFLDTTVVVNQDGPITIPANYGQDLSPRPQADGRIPAAGPYATKIHGDLGFDAGNVLNMEYLTWRREAPFNNGAAWEDTHGGHAYAAVAGFRDYNLDGWLDQGEVRNPGSENYLIDDLSCPDLIPGTSTHYPWNRQRLLEDCIEVLDDGGIDFDDWVDPVAMARVTCPDGTLSARVPPALAGNSGTPVVANGVLSGIVLLPPGSYTLPLGFVRAGSYYPIHNEDGLSDPDPDTLLPRGTTPQVSWNLFVNDLVVKLDSVAPALGFKNAYSAHEYLHTWEGFPDLYDYDIYGPDGLLINTPIGQWDIMAGSGGVPINLVHSVPILKEKPCTEWIEPVDLTTVLTPGVDTSVTLPPAEFVRDESYFFLENPDRLGERYYFWSAGSGFDMNMPGAGMLILHTDVGSNPDALPVLGNVTGTRFNYVIVQADGLGQLDSGEVSGDVGDPWPGSTENTQFDCSTTPASEWYTLNTCSGLKIVDIVPDQAGSVLVTFNWRPTGVPSLEFINPPGGTSVGVGGASIYQVRAEATDVYGGTWMRYFYASSQKVCSSSGAACERDSDCPSGQFCMSDISIDPNGAGFIGCMAKPSPGTGSHSIDWNIQGVPDGRYVVFSELIPGLGDDGAERQHTMPRAGRNNKGDGSMTVSSVDTNVVVASGNVGDFPTLTTFQGFRTGVGTPVNFGLAGVETGDHLMTDNTFDRKPLLRRVAGISVDGLTLQLGSSVPSTVNITSWQVVKSDRTARSEAWTAVCVDPAGQDWRVNSSLSQPLPADDAANLDPFPHATTGVEYSSMNGEVTFTISAGGEQFGPGDMFTFSTTGITAASRGVTITNGQIREGPTAVIDASPLAGDSPLTVFFDGRGSTDPGGQVLEFEWNFGDGTPVTTGVAVTSHEFRESRTFTVVLRVTNPINRRSDQATVDIAVTNNSPDAVVVASPLSGPAPLLVSFSAAQSDDTESKPARDRLIFEWDFGDGSVAGSGIPGHMMEVDHLYSIEGTDPITFTATLTVTDEGGKQDTDVVKILVGNTLPVANVSRSTLQGPAPHKVLFNASGSFDADGDPLTVVWKWDDGTPDTVPLPKDESVEHTFANVGRYEVSAVISDGRGGSTNWPGVTVEVTDASGGASIPVAEFNIDTPTADWVVGNPIEVDASRSYDEPEGSEIVDYLWDWGDGMPWGAGVTASHAYGRAGEFTIKLYVVDGEDPPNKASAEKQIQIAEESTGPGENHPPSAVMLVNPTEGEAGRTVFAFDASDSSDEDGDLLRFTWLFGDGMTATGAKRTYVYAEPGLYLVRLTVRDEANASSEQTRFVSVTPSTENDKPLAFIGAGPRTGAAPFTVLFDGQNSYDPDGDTIDFKWFVNGVLVGIDSTLRYTFTNTGSFAVMLQVSDGREIGQSAEETVFVTAPGAPPDGGEGPQQPIPDGDGGDIDSALQRPGLAFCGLGMLPALFGAMLALFAVRVGRRTYFR